MAGRAPALPRASSRAVASAVRKPSIPSAAIWQAYTVRMAAAIIASLPACSTPDMNATSMNSTNPLNLTRNAKLLLAVAGLLLWGIGGTIDGASLRSLLSVPIFVAVWMALIWVIDRWVRPGRELSPLAPRTIDAASATTAPPTAR
jgi:hypothetical protein